MEPAFQYQIEGGGFLSRMNFALLADEMGLGKTRQAILGLNRIHAVRSIVICPSVARINWKREFEMWSLDQKTPVTVLRELKDPVPDSGHVICSFDYASANVEKIRKHQFEVGIVDEAHFLKSHDAKRAKAIMGAKGVIRACQKFWLMSGTPAPNHPGELWIMFYTFGVTPLTYDAFIREFCVVVPTQFGPKVVSAKQEKIPELRQLLSRVMLRRLKKDVMKELPPITYGHVNLEPGLVDFEILPSFVQYFIPSDRRQEMLSEIQRQETLLKSVIENMGQGDINKLTAISALSDSVSTLRRYIGLQKCDGAIELISKELEAGAYKKIVLFAIHRDVIETMRVGLRKFNPVVLYGNTPLDKRQANVDRFQKNPKCQVFIGNIHAAGTALTLTASHHVDLIEQDWVPGNNAQAIMRCHRIGQEHPVSVRFHLLDGTLDAKIGYILKRKTRDLTAIFD